MAEPATVTKVTITTVLGGLVGAQFAPLMVEWVGVIFGAGVGASFVLSFAPKMDFWAGCRVFLLAFCFGMVATWAAEVCIEMMGLTALVNARPTVRPFLAIIVTAFSRQIMLGIPELVRNWRRGGAAP